MISFKPALKHYPRIACIIVAMLLEDYEDTFLKRVVRLATEDGGTFELLLLWEKHYMADEFTVCKKIINDLRKRISEDLS